MMNDSPVYEVLLAEDSKTDIMLVREALSGHHIACNLHIISDGAETLAFIDARESPKQPRIDLVLLDMHLPKCDGAAILKKLRSTERNAQTPVIVLTGSTAPHTRETAQRHAALHYFVKPTNLEGFMKLGEIAQNILCRRKPPGIESSTDLARGHGSGGT